MSGSVTHLFHAFFLLLLFGWGVWAPLVMLLGPKLGVEEDLRVPLGLGIPTIGMVVVALGIGVITAADWAVIWGWL